MSEAPDICLSLWRGEILAPNQGAKRMAEILVEVAARHSLTVADLTGQSRKDYIVLARQEAMWIMSVQTWADGSRRHSSGRIGKVLGDRDHTTVLHGVRAHLKRLAAERAAA